MTWKYLGYELTPELIYLIETLKIEGYWSVKHRDCTIQNKDLEFLRKIEDILNKYKIKLSKQIYVKIKLPDSEIPKNTIVVKKGGKELTFHIEKSPFDGSKKVSFKLPYSKRQEIKLFIGIREYSIIIKESKYLFKIASKLKSFAYLEIRFYYLKFIKALNDYVISNKSKELRIEKTLFNLSPIFIVSALSALIDTEGTLDYYKHTRRIKIRMNNENYLKDWKVLLKKIGIDSHVGPDGKLKKLTISGWQDFNKLDSMGLKLFHSKKRNKWKGILSTYKRHQISRNSYYNYYIRELKENGPIPASDLAKKLSKSKRVINHYLTKLDRKNLIKVDKSRVRYIYSAK